MQEKLENSVYTSKLHDFSWKNLNFHFLLKIGAFRVLKPELLLDCKLSTYLLVKVEKI